jgi:demethylmenaquinone methyltransferase/2-methoxy-6-polyprenyl-1,4-benzoquinol methylase
MRDSKGVVEPTPLPPHQPLERYYRADGSPRDSRRKFVTELFDRTAGHYEWLNRVMSFGSGPRYRRQALTRAGLRPGMRVLDVAVGTGLTARAALAATDGTARVTGVDASLGMLHQARQHQGGLALLRGFAEQLPFASGSFDFLSMGYALRHVTDLSATFREWHRVLRPGGRLVILELTRPTSSGLRYTLTRVYLQRIIPFLARFRPGGADARTLMEYYWDTIDACVSPETVLGALREAGFEGVERNLVLNVFSEYVGTKK